MRTVHFLRRKRAVALVTASLLGWLPCEGNADNIPPSVRLLWPTNGVFFGYPQFFKFKTTASDTDGSISKVEFLINTNSVGRVTNPPFNLVAVMPYPAPYYGSYALKVVATDNGGAKTESNAEVGYPSLGPPLGYAQIVSPAPGAVFPAPATFVFSAELLAAPYLNGVGMEFFIGTNSLGVVDTDLTATGPPSSVTVTNLGPGDYQLAVRHYTEEFAIRVRATIHVVRLGATSPRLTLDGRFEFEVLTSFPGKDTIIQTSSNLLDWTSISTNQPSTNVFTFAEPFDPAAGQRLYRVIVPSP